MYRLPSCAECVPPTWLALGLDQSPSSLLPAWYQFWSFRAAPPSQFRRGRRHLSSRGRVPPTPEVPDRPPTPLNGYTFTLFRRHPCRHSRSSIRLQAIHMHHSEQLVSFPAHGDPSSIQYFGDEHRAKPREPAFVPALCRESIPALQLDIPASGLYRRSHVFDATLPVATPHRRAGTLLAILPGVRSHPRSFVADPAHISSHSGPVETLFHQRQGACRA